MKLKFTPQFARRVRAVIGLIALMGTLYIAVYAFCVIAEFVVERDACYANTTTECLEFLRDAGIPEYEIQQNINPSQS